MFEKTLTVSGLTVTLRPYTAKRHAQLDALVAEIQAFLSSNPEWGWDDIPQNVKVAFWKRKAEILWEATYPTGFFEALDFEYSLLKDSELHFIMMQVYL